MLIWVPSKRTKLFVTTASILLSLATVTYSQATKTPPAPTASAAPAATPAAVPDKPALKPEELEQLLAPIALYPDSLITQMLMASTYPLEIVQADRWAKANKELKGDKLAVELEKQPWDPSVKSLVNFPQVLAMMSEKLDLTVKIGDAFIDQQADVMNTVQKLRNKANAQGQLKSNEQQKVIVEAAPPVDTTIVVQQPAPAQIIRIEPTQPEVIYVPSYSPTVVYGAWPYPAYPPAPYYPPGYVASNVMSFGLGVACGAAWGYAWGNSNWGGGDVDIDVDRNTNINNNIDRSKHKENISNRQNNRANGTGRADGAGRANGGGKGSWQHNPQHRQGTPYRNQSTANRMGQGGQQRQTAAARDQYRGRADAGRQDLGRGNAGAGGAQNRAGAGAGGAQNRAGSTAGNRAGTSAGSTNRGGSLSGVDRGGSAARADSARGASSRSGSSASRSGSGSRSGGGASRGGGGGGSRGGGGGGRGGGGGGRGRSDVNLKTEFAVVDPHSVLRKVAALPITTWSYKDEAGIRHLGPMAQDFYRAFGIGDDDKTITFLDEGGVALSAVQALNAKVDEKDARIQALEREVRELKALVQKLAAKSETRNDSNSTERGH